jgi:NAD(P)-dependent dehydrogenase (short-subunit alcohol dehydrogenase family)
VTSKEDLSRAVETITKNEGFINVLIANSGITGPTLFTIPPNPTISQYREYLWNTSVADFTQTFEVNTSGVYLCVVAFLELLAEGNKKKNVEQLSQVIAVSSIGGYNRVPLAGFAYAASKAGTTHMMKQLATALVPFDIRSNIIAPGSKPSPSFFLFKTCGLERRKRLM